MISNLGNRLIVALDVPTGDEALALIEKLDGAASFVKVGLQLFISEGPRFVEGLVVKHNLRVMLDLKLHDIPNTVLEAAKRADGTGAELITAHTAGGRDMLDAAVRGSGHTKVLAVTVLTSLDIYDLQQISGTRWTSVRETVRQRMYLADEAGCFGIVASPHEATMLKTTPRFNTDMIAVCPGIRPAAVEDDQKRVMTPSQARKEGADMIVVGRPIRNAENPALAAKHIAEDFNEQKD